MTRTFLLILITALSLSACGRKGDLEAPANASNKAYHGETHII